LFRGLFDSTTGVSLGQLDTQWFKSR
jgi:hypothetical protein